MKESKLFVYGTLRRGQTNAASSLLSSAKFVEFGVVAGQLLDLGSYPAAIENGESTVAGEVYRLEDFDREIAAIDAYEGIDPVSPPPHEYERRLTTVRLTGGQETLAWIYWFAGDAAAYPLISSGDWLDRSRSSAQAGTVP